MTVIDGVFCLVRACYKQTQYMFQPLRLTGVRLCAVITLQTLWWDREKRSRSWNIYLLSAIVA